MPLQTRHRKLRLNLSPSADNSDINNDSQEKVPKKLSIKLSLKKASSQDQPQENGREESDKDKNDPDYFEEPKTKRRKATRAPKTKKTFIVKFKYKSETSLNINISNENRSTPENNATADGIPTPNPSQYSKATKSATNDLPEDATDEIPLSQLTGHQNSRENNAKEGENNQTSGNRDPLNSPEDLNIENNTHPVNSGSNSLNKNDTTNPNLRKVIDTSRVAPEDSTLDFSDDSAEIDALLDAIGTGTQANNSVSNVPNNGVNQTPTNQTEYQQYNNVRIPYEHTRNGQVRAGNVVNIHPNNPNIAYNHVGFHNVGQISNGFVSPFSVSGYTTGAPNSAQLGVASNGHQTQYNAHNQQFSGPNHFAQQQQKQTGEAFDDDDDDLVESAVLISLLDPITSNRIRIPVRSRVCSHLDCFDLISFRELNRLSPFNVVSRNQASFIARPKVLALLDDAKRRPLNPQKI
ncbi:unnamed protein product [[Candida] boidinii]|uniref:Unnamed protein product n=1 Tax=Candida boidinii TaxID=5477 RepID=A0ACB5TQ68_CANBO|nr:unnamed protein product [[Candida] boidinii]